MQLQTLQAYRGLAALWVLLYHANAISVVRLGRPWGNGLFQDGILGVDFFFVLSGFIIYHVHARDLGRPETAPTYLLKRFFRIYPLLFVVMSAKLFYSFALGGGGVPEAKLNGEVILSSFLMLPISDALGGKPLIDVAWTLSHEFLFYGLFGLGILLGRRFLLGLFTSWGLLIVLTGAFLPGQSGLATGFLLEPHNLQFIAGVAVGMLADRDSLSARSGLLLLSLGLLALLLGLTVVPASDLHPVIVERLFWAGAFALIIAGSVGIESRRPIPVPRWLRFLGDSSYAIYLVHASVQVLAVHVGHGLAMDFGLGHDGFLCLVALLSLVGGFTAHLAIERPLQLATSRIVKRQGEGSRGAPQSVVPPAGVARTGTNEARA